MFIPDRNYYARYRGHVSGPHTPDDLTRMVRRGTLSRAHELSEDSVHWTRAGENEALFGMAPAGRTPAPEVHQPSPPVAPSMFFKQDNQTYGPMPLAMMQTLARQGALGPNAIVWSEGDQQVSDASQHPALASPLISVVAPVVSAPGSASRTRGGCGTVLLAGSLTMLAAGGGVAIWLSSRTGTAPDPKVAPPATAPVHPQSSATISPVSTRLSPAPTSAAAQPATPALGVSAATRPRTSDPLASDMPVAAPVTQPATTTPAEKVNSARRRGRRNGHPPRAPAATVPQ